MVDFLTYCEERLVSVVEMKRWKDASELQVSYDDEEALLDKCEDSKELLNNAKRYFAVIQKQENANLIVSFWFFLTFSLLILFLGILHVGTHLLQIETLQRTQRTLGRQLLQE